MSLRDGVLRCDWRHECTNVVTHIGAKGYVYCENDVGNRSSVERTRKLKPKEIEQLQRGEPIKKF